MKKRRRRPDPTPAQIRERCEKIQAGWSPAIRRKRAPWWYERQAVVMPQHTTRDAKYALSRVDQENG
ncbi:hypothetical protein [Bythopirellula goksoeyrii]|uniref:hypothetical protein n=1 Tax=Bythopirellula goksoeyrii TaxID=1400387 RepID=UPI0011CDB661|nr:hypothetical protein [Bythopirellula goksoeyrii]